LCKNSLDLDNYFCDALFFFENIVDELFRRKMLEIPGGIGILPVEVYGFQSSVGIVFQQIFRGDFPGTVVLLATLW
jgi:hypothetical protein